MNNSFTHPTHHLIILLDCEITFIQSTLIQEYICYSVGTVLGVKPTFFISHHLQHNRMRLFRELWSEAWRA